MLKKANRLNHVSFAKNFSTGKRIHNAYTTVIYTPTQDFASAVVVSKKIYKKAHERNLIKRRFYAIIRKIIDDNRNIKGEYIFITKPTIKNLTKGEFKRLVTLEVGRTLK